MINLSRKLPPTNAAMPMPQAVPTVSSESPRMVVVEHESGQLDLGADQVRVARSSR